MRRAGAAFDAVEIGEEIVRQAERNRTRVGPRLGAIVVVEGFAHAGANVLGHEASRACRHRRV